MRLCCRLETTEVLHDVKCAQMPNGYLLILTKKIMETLKNKIKELANKQLELKNQRKSVNIKGERKMPEWQAAMTHFANRIILREMNVVQALSRGRAYEQIERNPKEPFTDEQLTKLIEKYEKYTVHSSGQQA